ncbi:TPA: hypothetical protein I9089_002319 [Clostridium perfringens]|nr:hypothetical protein [Clostridium perfringens]
MITLTKKEFEENFKLKLKRNGVSILEEKAYGTGTLYKTDKVIDINWNEQEFLVDDVIIEKDKERINKALKKLHRLKVDNYHDGYDMSMDMHMDKYFTPNFFMIWWRVSDELSLYEEGEDSELNSKTYSTGKRWIEDNRDLANKYFIK